MKKKRLISGVLAAALLFGTVGSAAAGGGRYETEKGEVHRHTFACYDVHQLQCDDSSANHKHTEGCYIGEGDRICGLEDSEEHIHNEEGTHCNVIAKVLVCEQEEHTHGSECYDNTESEAPPDFGEDDEDDSTQNSDDEQSLDEENDPLDERNLSDEGNSSEDEDNHRPSELPEPIPFSMVEMTDDSCICGIEEHIHNDSCYQEIWECRKTVSQTEGEEPPTLSQAAINFIESAEKVKLPTSFTKETLEDIKAKIDAAETIYASLSENELNFSEVQAALQSLQKIKTAIMGEIEQSDAATKLIELADNLPDPAEITMSNLPSVRRVLDRINELYSSLSENEQARILIRQAMTAAEKIQVIVDREDNLSDSAAEFIQRVQALEFPEDTENDEEVLNFILEIEDISSLYDSLSENEKATLSVTDAYEKFMTFKQSTPSVSVTSEIEGYASEFDGYVSNLAINKIIDGTEPWDSSDSPGNDSGNNNKLVRTFDTVKYSVDASWAARSTNVMPNATIQFEAILDAGMTEAQFDINGMSWINREYWQISYLDAEGNEWRNYLWLI